MAPVIEPVCDKARAGLLLAAHGERRPGAGNEGVFRIAQVLAARGLEVAVGFIAGEPTIGTALRTLVADRVLVYPLFASNGYFTRDRLVKILDEANDAGRSIEMLAPLGLDPGLAQLVTEQAGNAVREHGLAPGACTVILLAHGSQRNPASRQSTEGLAQAIERLGVFRKAEVAFLEELPSLDDTAATVEGPAVVVGVFSGEGLHGAKDAPRLVARLGRADVVFAGIMGAAPGIADLVAQAVAARLALCD